MVAKKPTTDTKINDQGGALQMSFFTPESEWRPTPVSELPSWAGAKRIAIDCETRDPQLRELGPGPRRDGYVTGWAFAIEGGPQFYLPYRHEGGDNLPEDEVLRYLRENMKGFTGDYVGANLSYDVDYAATDDLVFHSDAKFRDIQIADPLIYELHYSFSLKEIGKRWGVESKKEELLEQAAKAYGLSPKGGMWRLPARYVGEYAQSDVSSPLELYAKQRIDIERKGLQRVFDLETDVLPVLVRMRQRGVRIDQDKLAQISKWSLDEEGAALARVRHATGVHITVGDVWKPGALAPALEQIGVKLHKTKSGAPQIDADLLDSLNHPVASDIKRARKINKIRTTFAASVERYMVNGRLHCSIHQIAREDEKGDQKGARYGRCSATDPNLQQQPNPEKEPEIAGEWRKIYIPEEGAIYGVNDFSQQEPRWTTHFAAVMDLPKAREAAKRYRDDPTVDNHDMMTRLVNGDDYVNKLLDKMAGEELSAANYKIYKGLRGESKAIFLGLCYGEGGPKLCQDLGKPTRWMLTVGWGRNKDVIYFDKKKDALAERFERQTGYVREAAGEEGQSIIDRFDSKVPFVRMLAKEASDKANSVGFVKTILGRRLHFKARDDGGYDFTHKALNRVIQGSSADQTKQALVDMDRAGYFIQLQVHDEIDGSYGSVEEAKSAGKIMKDSILGICQPLVPFNVDTECGPSWGEIKEV